MDRATSSRPEAREVSKSAINFELWRLVVTNKTQVCIAVNSRRDNVASLTTVRLDLGF